jgi:hypothetical protein
MLKVQTVGIEYITQIWSNVAPFIGRAVQYTNDYNLDQIKVFLTTGAWLLLVAVDDLQQIHGVATIAFHNGANDRTAIITALGGKQVVNQNIFDQVRKIVRGMGATRVQVYTRDSAIRLYEKVGLKKKATLMEIKI